MKQPTVASLKKVTAENLASLGIDRLAEILVDVAEIRPELKRRLRMELAAGQGADHLALEIDKRIGTLDSSRSKVSWRQRPTFVRDLDVLRALIANRLATLDAEAGLNRMWLFMDIARRVGLRVRDRDGELAAVFDRAASDIGGLLRTMDQHRGAAALVDAVLRDPSGWGRWLPAVLEQDAGVAKTALGLMGERRGGNPGWVIIVRQLADAAGDVEMFRSTYAPEALRMPSIAAEVAQRLLGAGLLEEAGDVLRSANSGKGAADPEFDWETAWISYLELSGESAAAQAARWASFERTLSAERAKAFTSRLADFDDVEAEHRAFAHAAGHPDFQRGLRFLMDWPALAEAGQMIQTRADEIKATPEQAETWAGKLRARQPTAAHLLLRKAAADAFRRRDFATCDRLTLEADQIVV